MNTREAALKLLKVISDYGDAEIFNQDPEIVEAISDLEKSLEKEPSAEEFLKEKGMINKIGWLIDSNWEGY